MTKNIKQLLEQQAAANLKTHREADQLDDFDVGRKHTKIALDRITVGDYQPRLAFSEDGIRDLAESISQIGLTQPITVRPRGKDYELIAGERRLRAHHLLAKPTIEAIVVEADDGQAAAMALSENIDREGLSDFEIALGIKKLQDKYPKRAHLAKALNLGRGELYRYLAFHELPETALNRLQKKPSLIGRRAAEAIAQALKQSPTLADRLDEALALVDAGKLEQGRVVAFLQQSPTPQTQAPAREDEKPVYLKQGRARVASIARTPKDLVIKVAHAALPKEKADKLQKFLRELLLEEGAR